MKEEKKKQFFFLLVFFTLKVNKGKFEPISFSSNEAKQRRKKRWKCHSCLRGWAPYILFTVTSSTNQTREKDKTKRKVIITRLCGAVREKRKS